MESRYDLIYKSIKDSKTEHREIYDELISLVLNLKGGIKYIKKSCKVEPLQCSAIDNDNDNDNYKKIDKFALQLSLQLKALEEKGFSFLFLQVSDILVINDDLYLLANLSQMVPLNKKDNSHFVLACPNVYPFPKEVCAPELLEMNALHFISHRSASYYSLALLCLTLLKCSNLSLDKLQGTKLVYFIERCLKKEPMERMCLYF